MRGLLVRIAKRRRRDHRARFRLARNSEPGFTLLEVLVVTLILALLISVVTPQFRHSFENLQFKNFVLDISTLMQYARDRAILEKDTYRLRFFEDPAGCRLEKLSRPEEKEEAEFRPIRDRTGAPRLLPRNVTADTEPSEIVFFPDGSATDAHWSFRDAKDHTMALRVSPESGDITLEESDD